MAPLPFEADQPTVMGHEFCCEVVELGPGCENLAEGDIVVCMPVAFDAAGVHAVGFSNLYPGGYAELMVLNDLLALKVPNGLSPRLAALTEPLAVGVHAVAKSGIRSDDAAIVLGCGPVGLAVHRRAEDAGHRPHRGRRLLRQAARRWPSQLGRRRGGRSPGGDRPSTAWRRVDGTRPMVIFEAVGVPGMIDRRMRMAPRDTRILVVGACMQEDRMRPMLGIGKELSPAVRARLRAPRVRRPLLRRSPTARSTSRRGSPASVTVDGVPQAFADLADPDAHAKILVVRA